MKIAMADPKGADDLMRLKGKPNPAAAKRVYAAVAALPLSTQNEPEVNADTSPEEALMELKRRGIQ